MIDPNRPYWRAEIDKVFEKVKAEMHREAVLRGEGVALYQDCYTGEVLRGGDKYDYEHIRSAEVIFSRYKSVLTNDQIAEVVNCDENVKVTLRVINQSKGKTEFETWIMTADNVSKHSINLLIAEEAVKQADLGINRAVARFLTSPT
ncbi:hypothetical protein [Myroides odoratimimus]|uniref:hypothetical protein n=1 Tax=Myroides odoratimimus TaxID=76832 RepID=UPI001CE165B1|nr:hypothetical protein [Myroides odoratimimus]MCA4806454.1 hypothetical protein [Myroides odoratimimus]MDM1530838.1 hypothetical protein [Myroides odoratimimus]